MSDELRDLIIATDGKVLLVGPIAEADDLDADRSSSAPFAESQLPTRYQLIVLAREALDGSDAQVRAIFHSCAGHLVPGGTLAVQAMDDVLDHHARSCGFIIAEAAPRARFSRWQRSVRQTVHDQLATVRATLDRVDSEQMAGALHLDQVVILDTRTPTDREDQGIIPGSIHTPRTVLEWRCDPASGYTHPAITSFNQVLVVVCNDGYSSSFAAQALQDLGFHRATDLVGGVRAWIDAGHPVEPPAQHERVPPMSTERW